MGLVTIIIAVCLVAITVALFRTRRATDAEAAARTIEMESDVYEDIRAESQCHNTIKTECNEAYNYVMKHTLN